MQHSLQTPVHPGLSMQHVSLASQNTALDPVPHVCAEQVVVTSASMTVRRAGVRVRREGDILAREGDMSVFGDAGLSTHR